MKALKILMVITALVVIVGLTSDAWAGCLPGRLFRSSGKLGNNLDFTVVGADNSGNQIGRFWDSDDSANSNNGLTDIVGDGTGFGSLCPPVTGAVGEWWTSRLDDGNMRIDGVQGGEGCGAAGCPESRMTVVVEDYAAGGPPGIGASAYYAAYLVDETPASGRWWDYGNMDGITANDSLIAMLEFPLAEITGSSRDEQTIQINYNNAQQEDMVHSTDWGGGGGVFPTADAVLEWHLVKATGTSDPGRLRSNGWVTIQTTPYVPGGAPNSFVVACANTATDEYLAIGIGFNGGAGGMIESALVGAAIPLECDPNLAQPDTPVDVGSKPNATELNAKPGRSGGRR